MNKQVSFEVPTNPGPNNPPDPLEQIQSLVETPMELSRTEQWREADKMLEDMFGLGPYDPSDPKNPGNLPNQTLTKAEEARFAEKIALGDKQAGERYMMRRLRFVLQRARNLHNNQTEGSSLSLQDHFQNGLESLVGALDSYDVAKYKKQPDLREYISLNLRSDMQRAQDTTANIIKMPVHILERLDYVNKHKDKLISSLGRWPEEWEIAVSMKWPVSEVRELINLDEIRQGITGHSALGEDNGDFGHADIINEVSNEVFCESINDLLSKLPDRDRRVVELRYGLKGNEPSTFDEVAAELDLSRERTRQIEASSLKRIKRYLGSLVLRTIGVVVSDTPYLAQSFPNRQPSYSNEQRLINTGLERFYLELKTGARSRVDIYKDIVTYERRLRSLQKKRHEDNTWLNELTPTAVSRIDKRKERRERVWHSLKLTGAPREKRDIVMKNLKLLEITENVGIYDEDFNRARGIFEKRRQDRSISRADKFVFSRIEKSKRDIEGFIPGFNSKDHMVRVNAAATLSGIFGRFYREIDKLLA